LSGCGRRDGRRGYAIAMHALRPNRRFHPYGLRSIPMRQRAGGLAWGHSRHLQTSLNPIMMSWPPPCSKFGASSERHDGARQPDGGLKLTACGKESVETDDPQGASHLPSRSRARLSMDAGRGWPTSAFSGALLARTHGVRSTATFIPRLTSESLIPIDKCV